MLFKDRADAGRKLAAALEAYKKQKSLLVYALPRGGTVLGAIIAKHLKAPLTLITPRKIGHPSYPEYAVAAVSEDGTVIAKPAEIMSIDEEWLQSAVNREKQEAKRRHDTYLRGMPEVSAENKTAIIVDDGIATGLTMLAAVYDIRRRHPARIVVAVPVMPYDILASLQDEVDEVVALAVPGDFAGAIGAYYETFEPVEDDEVRLLLTKARAEHD